VVAVPDARKGERLILVTQKKDATRADFMVFARQRGASDLMIPAEIMVMDKLPLLGNGKVDLVSLNKTVSELYAARTEPARAHA
jgi:acyl-[acyl-carrier-protein]-phospholipid O-acyltransferase/long-chain-fatty-acid--[acyl-carrier-protein] ligase